jgi:hypothetical protein
MKRLIPVVFFIILAGAFLYWWFSPAQVIKRRTESFLKVLTLQASESPTSRQMGAYSLNALLAEQVALENPTINEANGSFERPDLESAYTWLCQQAKQTRFELVNFESVSVTGKTARATFTLNALVELPTYRPADGIYQVVFDWQEAEDGWRLTSAKWTRP